MFSFREDIKKERGVGGVKEINNRQGEGAQFDLYTMTGRYYENPRCGRRNRVGRSQPGDWHISVGDEVKAAFKLLRVNLHTNSGRHANIWHLRRHGTQTHVLYTVNRDTDKYLHTHPHMERERSTQLLMCPLMQSEDKLLPLKAKPNQTRSVISVTVVFGFKAVRLTSDKTSMQSHPRKLCRRATAHTYLSTHTCAHPASERPVVRLD